MTSIPPFNPAPSRDRTAISKGLGSVAFTKHSQPVRFAGTAGPSNFLPNLFQKISDFFGSVYERLLVKPYEWLRAKLGAVVAWFKGKPAPSNTQGTPAPQPEASPSAPPPVLKLEELVTDLKPLFGEHLNAITFKQAGGFNTCYLLAALDSIFKHPQGQKILDKIDFYKTPTGYIVKFPRQPQGIAVSNSELETGGGVLSDAPGVRLIEQAYLKIPGVKKGEFGQPTQALDLIFDETTRPTQSVSMQNDPGAEQFIGGVQFPFASRKKQFQAYLEQLNEGKDSTDVDIMAAIPTNGNHYYSIRLHQPDPANIHYADPWDTSKDLSKPIDDFFKDYHIEGVRLPIPAPQAITQA